MSRPESAAERASDSSQLVGQAPAFGCCGSAWPATSMTLRRRRSTPDSTKTDFSPAAPSSVEPEANSRSPGTAITRRRLRSEEHTSELQSLMRTSYAVFCLKKKTNIRKPKHLTAIHKQHTNTDL